MMAATLDKAQRLDRLVTRWAFTARELRCARAIGLPTSWTRRPPSPVALGRLKRLPLADSRSILGRWYDADVFQSLDASFAMVDRAAARLVTARSGAVLAREDACLETFRRARELGRPAIYLLPTAYFALVQQLIEREVEELPEAFSQKELAADFGSHRIERKRAELEMATHVLCPSAFVGRSVAGLGVPAARVKVLSLGTDTSWPAPVPGIREKMFLFVGNITARKGVHRLIRAWKRLGAYRTHRLRLIGDLHLPSAFLAEHKGMFEHVPRIPREQLPAEYSRAQAFVFNALADGFGHVFAEAMVCGTPVLASRNCGAPDLVTGGVEGLLFDYGDDDQLSTALDWALTHPSALKEMGAAARRRAVSWGWSQFQDAFLRWIEPVVAGGGHWEILSSSRAVRAK